MLWCKIEHVLVILYHYTQKSWFEICMSIRFHCFKFGSLNLFAFLFRLNIFFLEFPLKRVAHVKYTCNPDKRKEEIYSWQFIAVHEHLVKLSIVIIWISHNYLQKKKRKKEWKRNRIRYFFFHYLAYDAIWTNVGDVLPIMVVNNVVVIAFEPKS